MIIVPNSWRDKPELAANPKMRVWNAFIGMIGQDEDEERHATKGAVHFDESEQRGSPAVTSSGGSKRKKSAGGSQDDGNSNAKNVGRRK